MSPNKRWSITGRLVVSYTLAALIVLVVANGFLYLNLVEDLRAQSRRRFAREIRLLVAELHTADNVAEVAEEIALRHAATRHIRHYVRILAPDGTLVTESPGMDRLVPTMAFPLPQAREESENTPLQQWTTSDGHSYLLGTVWVEIHAIADNCTLQLAYDVMPRKAVLSEYRRTGAIVMAIALCAAGITGVLITRRGLRPVNDIAAMASRVGSENLDERLGRHNWPREVDSLAISFDRMLERLQNDFVRLSQFSTNMAHEFRTPLNNLIGEAEVALSRERSAEEYKQVILSSLEEYHRLARLASSLLFLARAENRAEPLAQETVELRPALTELVDYYLPMAEGKGISLEVAPFNEILLNADPGLLRRAAGNVLANAILYTGEGGRVMLSAGQENAGVSVIIRDTGPGIPEEELPRLFERFYRVEGTCQLNPQGIGLGLSIVKSVMDLHGGTVTIESKPGAGTTVTLLFPAGAAHC